MAVTERATVLITGAAGTVGTFLHQGLPALGHRLRLLDRVPVEGCPSVVGDINDPAVLKAAMDGVTAVIHLAGAAAPSASFGETLTANIEGTYRVLEAARLAGVERFIFSSSNHAVGFSRRQEQPLAPDLPARPDSLYGVSKVYGEALGRYYADRYGMRVAMLRIGSCVSSPRTPRMLSTWLSPGDMVRLAHACLTAPDFSHTIVWGMSANTRGWFDLGPGRALGYHPQDDAEAYAADFPVLDPADPEHAWLGGRVIES